MIWKIAKSIINMHKELIKKYNDDDNIEKLLIVFNNLACQQVDLNYSLEKQKTYICKL